MRKLSLSTFTCALLLSAALPVLADSVTAEGAFEQLKSLSGTWTGGWEGEGQEAEAEAEAEAAGAAGKAVHEMQVSAAGTVMMETMAPGTDHEMINMYHLDGDDLMLTHYCAGGNQPVMRLDRENSSSDRLVFAYAGGTNLDPAVDVHIHAAEIQLVDGNHLVSTWTGYSGGNEAGKMIFHLARTE